MAAITTDKDKLSLAKDALGRCPKDPYLSKTREFVRRTRAQRGYHDKRLDGLTHLAVVRGGHGSLGSLLLEENGLLLVLAALVLEPDSDDAGAEASHFHKLLLHHGVGPGVGRVARPQRVKLFLVQHRPNSGRFLGFPPSWRRPIRLSICLACWNVVESVITRDPDDNIKAAPTEYQRQKYRAGRRWAVNTLRPHFSLLNPAVLVKIVDGSVAFDNKTL